MGGHHSTHVDATLQNIGISKIESGLTKKQAEELWLKFDTNADGELEAKEAAALFDQIGTLAIESLKKDIDILHSHMKDEAFIKGLLAHFDSNKDGKVTKAEFIKNMVKGYHIGAEIEKVDAEQQAAAAKEKSEVDKWEQEQMDKPEAAEEDQPDKKKAKKDDGASEDA